jgi:GT2 family glycosyltransferase
MKRPRIRAVIGVPVDDGGAPFADALESLLTQTYRDVRFVLVDDRSGDATTAIAARYATRDERVAYHRNPRRLGPAATRARALALAAERHPDAESFAWGSDRDVWHPRWLETLVHRLDTRPDAALAYTRHALLGQSGEPRSARVLDTSGTATAAGRLMRMARGLPAQELLHGLFRVDAVRRAGTLRSERLLLAGVALRGQLVEVPEPLWYRRAGG